MKTLTCGQLSGMDCDFKMTAATEEEMAGMGWKHANEAHPEKMKEMMAASDEDKAKGQANFHAAWEAAPEDGGV